MPQQHSNSNSPLIYNVLKVLPRNLISYGVGWCVRVRLPQLLSRPLIKGFVRTFGIDLSEAEHKIEAYHTIEDMFTRRLGVGRRPLSGEVVSPADGMLTCSGPATDGTALQVKGLRYSLAELVHGLPQAPASFSPAWAMTIYLAPHNYHRVHIPVAGTLKYIRYIPGDLWPVNDTFVRLIPGLFVKNERLVFHIELKGGGAVDAVMVGAFNVGRMTTPYLPGFASNQGRLRALQEYPIERPVAPGDEMGTFLLGSTVVLVFDAVARSKFRFVQTDEKRPIMMGHSIIEP